ncbi:MAG: DUF434 domain-containing protein [Methanotrichaceae archaeon]|nr:DUF434 domain-containing protein [Methanotrichaceae archaeon]
MILRRAAEDIRYLVNRGYTKESAIRFVSDHYNLPRGQRFVLFRVIIPEDAIFLRKSKKVPLEKLRDEKVFLDGYNVLIAVEALLAGENLYICDDGFLRDTQGIFRNYKTSEFTEKALKEILGLLFSVCPKNVQVLLDQQISMSGQLAAEIREMMAICGLTGTAKTAKDVDHQLKVAEGIIATGDGNILDVSARAVDLPGEISKRLGLEPKAIF